MIHNSLIVILGPTASGKTSIGIEIAKAIGGVVVSADSRQIYRYLDIGAAKPYWPTSGVGHPVQTIQDSVIVEGIPHYLVDIVDPDQPYTVADYQRDAMEVIKNIHSRGKVPIMVGGTGLYISAVVDQLRIPRVPPDLALRAEIEAKIAAQGIDAVYLELLKLDPKAKDIVASKNPRRIIRALEVCMKTGTPFTAAREKGTSSFSVLQVGVQWPTEEIYKRIDHRVDEMMAAGLLQEVRALGTRYGWDLPSMSGHGYRQLGMHIRGEMTLADAVALTKQETRNYAKRQMTWFKRDTRIQWCARGLSATEKAKEFFNLGLGNK